MVRLLLILLVSTISLCSCQNTETDSSTVEQINSNDQLKIEHADYEANSYGQVTLNVRVKNLSDKQCSVAHLKGIAYNDNGDVIQSGTSTVNFIAANSTENVSIFLGEISGQFTYETEVQEAHFQ